MLTPVPVPRLWPGATVACLASGPSLTRADVALVRAQGLPTIVVNTTYQMAPWADVLYACDAKWWAWQQGAPGFRGQLHQPVHLVRVDQLCASQVEDLVADRDTDPIRRFSSAPEASERKVLDRKVGRRIVGRLDPARQRRIVRSVYRCAHAASMTPRRS